MRYQGFVGPSYQSLSARLHSERSVNLFPEVIEAEARKTRMALIGAPGFSQFLNFGQGPIRGLYAQDGRAWAVAGEDLFEFYPNGTSTNRGNVTMAVDPVAMVSNGQQGHQLLTVSNGKGFILDLTTNTFSQIGGVQFPAGATQAGFVDGYFVVLVPGTSLFQLSALFDGLTWDTSGRAVRSTAADNLVGQIVDHRELWLFGSETMEVWIDSGGATFPLQPLRGTVIQVGLLAPWSPAKVRDAHAIAWLGKTDGPPRVFLAKGSYEPQPISTHAVERVFRGYGETAQRQARGFTYQEDGHAFYGLHFPTEAVAWVYDVTESQKAGAPLWHERTRWNQAQGIEEAPTGWCHCYAFGRHLVGSRDDGRIYTQSLATYTDTNGNAMRRVRRAPYLSAERVTQFHRRLEVDAEMGTIADTSDPQVTLRSSDDGWQTSFSHGPASLGQRGEYGERLEWFQLGSSRERGYEAEFSTAGPIRITEAFLDVTLGSH